MKLGELKKALNSRFTADFDDCEVVLQTCKNGKTTEYDLLAGLAHYPNFQFNAVVLCGETEIRKLAKQGKIKLPKKSSKWRCLRCGANVKNGRCKCKTGPSPWEQIQ